MTLPVHFCRYVHGAVVVTAVMVSVPFRHAGPSAAGGFGHACTAPAAHFLKCGAACHDSAATAAACSAVVPAAVAYPAPSEPALSGHGTSFAAVHAAIWEAVPGLAALAAAVAVVAVAVAAAADPEEENPAEVADSPGIVVSAAGFAVSIVVHSGIVVVAAVL